MIDDRLNREDAADWPFEEWVAFFESVCNSSMHIHLAKDNRTHFVGSARPVRLFGLSGMQHASNGVRFERTSGQARLGPDDYTASLQLAGEAVSFQNDRVLHMVPGDLTLLDSTRPVRRIDRGRSLGFRLPRQAVISHLGHEPQGGLLSQGTLAGRLVFQLAAEAINEASREPSPGDTYMQMAVYDLFCAAFARPDQDHRLASRHTEKLFEQVCSIIRDGITDPNLTPSKVAAEAGIPLRYLQKLFTPKGTTCVHFIQTLRLDHAAHLLYRRSMFGAKQSISEIAHASGFRDYTFFSRKFRERFGCVPSSYMGGE